MATGREGGRRRPAGGTFLAGAAVVGSYLAARTGVGDAADERVRSLLTTTDPARSDRLVGVVTDLGSIYGLLGVSGALAATGRRRLAVTVLGSGLTAWTAAQSIKPLLDRPRPYELGTSRRLVAPPAGSSWPSGHTAVTAAMVATVLPELPSDGAVGRIGWVTGIATTAAVGASRIRVGVHHLSDVVAGVGVGALSAIAARQVRRVLARHAASRT